MVFLGVPLHAEEWHRGEGGQSNRAARRVCEGPPPGALCQVGSQDARYRHPSKVCMILRLSGPHGPAAHLRLCVPAHRMEIITPKEYVGSLIELSQERRGDFVDMKYMTEARTTLVYEMPLAEVQTDPPATLHLNTCGPS
jgi:Elongation factor G C-terminus